MPSRFHVPLSTLRRDFTASLVVFLVALPLCAGVAVASGVPAELGLVTGVVGGLVAGLLPGSSLQVSGPAAGLTVLVYEAVQAYGLATLGVIVLVAGLAQVLMGALRLGRWFRAISTAVIHGMLTGIAIVLIVGQLYSATDARAPGTTLANLAGVPGLLAGAAGSAEARAALGIAAGTIALLTLWRHAPGPLRMIPGPLVAVGLASTAAALLDVPVATIEVRELLDAVRPPDAAAYGRLLDVGVVGTALAFALIASAESLFSATAVDRLHHGPRTDYDKELMAQGAGNAVCGMLGALPMTAVIVRSAANVEAGARTKASRVLHGVWLLLFAALLPAALGLIPAAALAGVLIHAGCKLIPLRELGPLWREHRGEALVLAATAAAIITTNLFEGVLIGLALAVAKAAWETSHIHVEITGRDDASKPVRVRVSGNATFLRLPTMLDTLEALPRDRTIELNLDGLHHLDHACHTALTTWAAHRGHEGVEPVRVSTDLDRGDLAGSARWRLNPAVRSPGSAGDRARVTGAPSPPVEPPRTTASP